MTEYFETQTANEVNEIDFKRITQDNLAMQTEIQEQLINNISDKIDSIEENVTTPELDLTEITDMISEIDTNTIAAQNQDIIDIIQEQQQQINDINDKLVLILDKLE